VDLATRLQEVRKASGLNQKQVAALSGVHEKTLSSYESNRRIGRMKIEHLLKILAVVGMSPAEFFAGIDEVPRPVGMNAEDTPAFLLFDRFMALPAETQNALIPAFHLLIDIVVSREVRRAVLDPVVEVRSLRDRDRKTG
jgi:transcriptional regulator with XRE-family HTH domain